jgi:uncharacterized protein
MANMESNFIQRYISDFVFSEQWLGGTMLFVAGPRQCGKTFLVRRFLADRGCQTLYYNWDLEKVRRRYRSDPDFLAKEASRLQMERPWAVLDEIHKVTRWKNILKGLYDEYGLLIQIIVTGSARLDLLRRGGDSLVGRYTMAHLFPFSLREWAEALRMTPGPWLHEEGDWEDPARAFNAKLGDTRSVSRDLAEAYVRFGPFPAPLLSGSETRSRKWHRDYLTLLVREDLRDLSGIKALDRIANLVELLPERVGSTLSLRGLGEDLEANHTTVKSWLNALKRLYLVWPLTPYSRKLQRALKKDQKWYFLDWTYAGNEGSRFENMIATALLRFVTSLDDRGWPQAELHFVRTYDRKEIDFVLTVDKKPVLAVEAKLGCTKLSKELRRFRETVGGEFPVVQVVGDPGIFVEKGANAYVVGYDRFQMILG